jgi:hypothetical protein
MLHDPSTSIHERPCFYLSSNMASHPIQNIGTTRGLQHTRNVAIDRAACTRIQRNINVQEGRRVASTAQLHLARAPVH